MPIDWITVLGTLWAGWILIRLEIIVSKLGDHDDRITKVEYETGVRGD